MPMTDGQDMLGQNLVDFRNEERRARWESEPSDRPTPDEYADLAFCTQSDDCRADVADHLSDCPVEQRLREEFGY